ncbi:protein ELYS isoform X2 [Nerophis ophidion]|nr:protein ELYS isoform X2 [Nerophis ophidion]XP_061734910.1 protein ELYS isoform X2 [Nerophis ophidion]
MHALTAQVTSSLLPFPAVTLEALGEDEITLDSVLHGRFITGRGGHAWLACGPHLEFLHSLTGERLSAYCFSGGGEHPPGVLTARDFSWLKRSGLLVGLEETEGSVLCLYDLGLSKVAKAVLIPGRITGIEPLVSYGGASTSTQHLHQSLRWFFGIAAIVTDLGHVLLVDLCLDDLSCSQSELEASDLQVVTKSPGAIPRLREESSREGRHLCLQLNEPSGVSVTALQYIPRTNQLAVGFADGFLQLWNLKSLRKEYHSQLDGGRVPVHAFTFQEPENDPRNCCYLWAVQSTQDQEGDMVTLRLLQLAFSERKCLASGKILYEGLEYCEERYSQELSGAAFPLRTETTNTRLLSYQTIEKYRPHPDRDDSMNEAASPDTSVSIFSWQVKTYGQGTPSTYIGIFDINRWYHAQMPDSLRTGESLQNCSYIAVWCLDQVMQMASPHILLDVVVQEHSLSRGLPLTFPPPEQYFNPTAYNFDATCLFNTGIMHSTCSGYQKETLSFLKKAAPCSSDVISSSYLRCLMSGLLSSRLADAHNSNISQEEQLDAILSTAVETSSLGLITGCIKQWTAEEQPGSALNLRYILDWAWNKVIQTKEELDGICTPLFDSSSNFTDPQTMQLLQHSQQLLENLSTIFHCLLNEAQELTQKGLVGLINKNMVSSLISKYAQVILWFCRTGLLPEGSDVDAMQISRPFYSHSVISNYYSIRREELTTMAKGKWCADCLMIDSLVNQCGERLISLWKRDDVGTGQYPPPTLHALLDIYLLENVEEAVKHAVVIYLLLDVMCSFPNKEGASVESFPHAFAIPTGLVKLVQGLWLLDHRDHQSAFEVLLHPAASQCHFEWQHERVLQALMCQGQHSMALRYFHVTKPLISSTSQAKLCLSVLLHNRCLTEAWSLLRQHSNHLNTAELLGFLYESCQELGLIKELLKLPLGHTEQETLETFLQGTGGFHNREILMVHYLQQANYIPALQLNHSLKMHLVNERDPKLKERSNTRNSILEQYGKVLPRVQRKLAMERARPYQHPSTVHKEVTRPQPLSAISKRSANEKVMSRAGFINNVLTKIEEVWLGKGDTPNSSPLRSPRSAGFLSPGLKTVSQAQPQPFLGTPVTMSSKRKSRLVDLMVHPSCHMPWPLISPARPSSVWVSPKSTFKAPEFSLLQTPQVVKRARSLAASGPVFTAFTPQSILRSSLRPTPVATPSASPGRSITPSLRSKESRITFTELAESPESQKDIHWTNGMAADSEISLLTSQTRLSQTRNTWSSQLSEDKEAEQPHVKFITPEGGIPSPQLRCSARQSFLAETTKPSDPTQTRLSLSFDSRQTSFRSTDTTLEYYDAPLSRDQQEEEEHICADKGDDVVTVNIKFPTDEEEPEQNSLPTSEPAPLMVPNDAESEDKEVEVFKEVMAMAVEQENKNKQPVNESNTKQENAAVTNLVEASTHGDHLLILEEQSLPLINEEDPPQLEVMESTAFIAQIYECRDAESAASTHNLNAHEDTEASNFIEHMNVCRETESTTMIPEHLKTFEDTDGKIEPAENMEQSTDLTEFVQRHLFGSDLSPPLTHSGVHHRLLTTPSTEVPVNVEEDDKAISEVPPELISQKSTVSVTSSEPTGADSHGEEDLTDFVQRHLFGGDLSPPLARSGIHEFPQTTPSNEAPADVERDDEAAAEAPPVFTSQKSTTSVTSSEPTGSDSHSATSVNDDSEELSSAESQEDEEEEEELEEEEEEDDGEEEESDECNEEEDSGSEVEIIEEVHGNRGLRGLPPSSVFLHQEHDHFLPTLSEQEAAEFSLIPPGVEMKVVGEEMGGEVLMVRLGADTGVMEALEDDGQGSSYMELKPSATLLVPLEIMDRQQDTSDSASLGQPEIEQTVVLDDQRSESHSNFSLMLDVEEDANVSPIEYDPQSSQPSSQNLMSVTTDGPETEPCIVLLHEKDQDAVGSDDGTQEDEQMEIRPVDENKINGQTNLQINYTEELQINYTEEEQNVEVPHEHIEALEPTTITDFEHAPEKEPAEVLEVTDRKDSEVTKNAEEMQGEAENVQDDNNTTNHAETLSFVEEQHQELDYISLKNNLDDRQEGPSKTTTSESRSEDVEEVKDVQQNASSATKSEQFGVPETPTPQKKKSAQFTPKQMTTQGSRTVTFVSSLSEEPEETDKHPVAISASPSRTPKKAKQSKQTKERVVTPRRSTRKTQAQLLQIKEEHSEKVNREEDVDDASVAQSTSAGSPSKRQASQRDASLRIRQMSESKKEPVVAIKVEEVINNSFASEPTIKTSTPAKRRNTHANTPRRSSRRNPNNSEAMPPTLEVLKEEAKEEEAEEEIYAPIVKRSNRKTKLKPSKDNRNSSPGRTTRQSSRIALNVDQQAVAKTEASISEKGHSHETKLNSTLSRTGLRRTTRGKLWDHPEEDLFVLTSPIEVDSDTPVADALIKRLQEEEEKREGGVVRRMLRTRGAKSVVESDKDGLVAEPADDISPGELSYIFSPSRRRTRASRAESPGLSEELPVAVPRNKGRKFENVPKEELASEEDHVEEGKAVFKRTTGRRAAKSNAASEPPPVVQADVISPMPSPADLVPRAQKRIKEGNARTSGMNLRRKRIMETVFTRPVTRRKKL